MQKLLLFIMHCCRQLGYDIDLELTNELYSEVFRNSEAEDCNWKGYLIFRFTLG